MKPLADVERIEMIKQVNFERWREQQSHPTGRDTDWATAVLRKGMDLARDGDIKKADTLIDSLLKNGYTDHADRLEETVKRHRETAYESPQVNRALPSNNAHQAIMPPSVVSPSFGGKRKTKPAGFMPRMPGQKRRR